MNVHWESVLEGATAGIAASVILGLGALSRNYVRDFWFRLRLKREFRLVSCNWNLEGVTASLHNHLGQAFTVRHFALITERGDFLFNPLEEIRSSFKGEHPKPTRKQLRALKKGEIKEIPLSVEFQYRAGDQIRVERDLPQSSHLPAKNFCSPFNCLRIKKERHLVFVSQSNTRLGPGNVGFGKS